MSGGHHGPRSVEEMQEAEEIHAAEKLHEGIKGFYLTSPFDVEIEGERLGIRHDLEHALEDEHHKKAKDVIIDARVTEQLRQKIKREKKEKKTAWRFVPGSEEWRKNRLTEMKNFARALKNPLRWFRDDYDEYTDKIHEEYWDNEQVIKNKEYFYKKVLQGLPPQTLLKVYALLVPTNTSTTVTEDEVIQAFLDKKQPMPAEITTIRNTIDVDVLDGIFSGLQPPQISSINAILGSAQTTVDFVKLLQAPPAQISQIVAIDPTRFVNLNSTLKDLRNKSWHLDRVQKQKIFSGNFGVKELNDHLSNTLFRETLCQLSATEINEINRILGSTASVVDLEKLSNATPTQLERMQSLNSSLTKSDTLKKLIEIRTLEAHERVKVLSVHIYAPDRLREFSMDLGHPAETHDIPTILTALASHLPPLSQYAVDIINSHLGNPLGSPFDIQDLALASSAALKDIYDKTTLALGGTPVFQAFPEFGELIQARKSIEDKERLYQLLKDTLGDHFYDHIQGDHRKLTLLAHIENQFFAGDRDKLFVWLDEIKKDVANNLVGPQAEKTEKEKANSLKIDEGYAQIKKTASALVKKYREALTIPDKIVELDKELVKIRDAKVKAAAKGAVVSDQLEADVSRELRQTQQRKKDLPIEIQDLEQEYKDEGNDFILFLKNDLKVKSLNPRLTELESCTKFAAADLSDASSIFDKTKFSKMEKFVQTFVSDRKFSNEIQEEIKKIKSPAQIPPLSSDHLLFELNVRAAKEKFPDDTRAWKIARMATSFAQIDAKNVELFRAGNREIAQGKVKGWKGLMGVWRKSKQQIASGFFNSETFKGRDIIEHIAGLDHAFECFKDLPVDASLADIRNAIKHHGGISNENLMKFYMHLQEALKSFTVGHHRKVEIMDRDWPIEQVALFAEKIHAELEAREFVHKIEHPDTPEDKKLKLDNPAAYFQKLLNQREESQKKLEAAHLEQMRRPDSDWQVSWVKSLMKGKFGEAYQQALAKGKEQGLSGKALRDFVSSEGSIPKTVLKHLMTGLALKEAYDITSKSTKWIGSKLFNASKKAASVGVEKGGGILSAAWRNLGKPAVGATGRGLKAVGRGALRVGKFAAWDIWKFSFWTAPKWTVQKAWNITTFPFRMVGRGAKGFWNFFHYTEEKRARDAAWYAAKKGAAASHGGGGHGGGGHGGGH